MEDDRTAADITKQDATGGIIQESTKARDTGGRPRPPLLTVKPLQLVVTGREALVFRSNAEGVDSLLSEEISVSGIQAFVSFESLQLGISNSIAGLRLSAEVYSADISGDAYCCLWTTKMTLLRFRCGKPMAMNQVRKPGPAGPLGGAKGSSIGRLPPAYGGGSGSGSGGGSPSSSAGV